MFSKNIIFIVLVFELLTFKSALFAFSSASEIKPADNKPAYLAATLEVTNEAQICYPGIFREGAPSNMKLINNLENRLGKKFSVVMWYQDWSQEFPKELCDTVVEGGAVPHIVWEPWLWSDREKIKLDNIISGEWDNYIRNWAQEIKKWGKPVFIRWAHEFNIADYPWGIANNRRDPELYVAAYRHVHGIFTKTGALNAKWIWCPMFQSWPPDKWNDMNLAYPGDAYVDWIGLDGYNWGTTQPWSFWQSFKDLFRNVSRDLWRKHPTKPIMIAEFASAEKGGDKAAWISDIIPELKKMKYIKSIIWFDHKKETDWRVYSSQKAARAYQDMITNELFTSGSSGIADLTLVKETRKKRAFAQFTGSAPALDGDLSEWSGSIPLEINQPMQIQEEIAPWTGVSDLSGRIYVKWDDKNLYIAADIADNVPHNSLKKGKNIWNGDALEITFGLNPTAEANRTSFTIGDYQIGFGTGDGREISPSIWNWTKSGSIEGADIVVKSSTNASGYVLEAKVPWSNFDNYIPGQGKIISFDAALDDSDSKDREKQMVWSGDFLFYKDPGVWGELEFIK